MRDRLYRSRNDRMLFGVAGGLARYLNIDASIVRLVWVLLFLAAGTGILLYIVAAVVIPEEPEGFVAPAGGTSGASGSATGGVAAPDVDPTPNQPRDLGNGPIILGLILVVVGGWLLLQRYLPEIEGRVVWPALLLIVGLVLVVVSMRSRNRG